MATSNLCPAPKLDDWATRNRLVQTFPLSILKDAVIGVDASYYLHLRLNVVNEDPLIHALGGIPFCLKSIVEDDIRAMKEAGVTLIFIFNGLDFVNKSPSTSRSFESLKAQEDAWQRYLSGDAKSPLDMFQKASR